MAQGLTKNIPLDNDVTLVSDSHYIAPTQHAVKQYVDSNSNKVIRTDQSGGTGDTYGVLAGAINGSNVLFTVAAGAYVSGSLMVFLNGQLQTQGSGQDWVETAPNSGTFSFVTAPQTGDEITALYVGSILGGGGSGGSDPWIAIPEAATYSSVDLQTGVISFAGNLLDRINIAMKMRYKQDQALTAYWDLNANSNSQVGTFNGTDTAMTYTAGKFSNAATFNGTTSKIVLVDNAVFKPTGNFTIAAWVKSAAPSASPNHQFIFTSYAQNTAVAGIQFRLDFTTGYPSFILGKNTGTTNLSDFVGLTVPINCADNAWHYIVVTFSNNISQIYIDGIFRGRTWMYTPVFAATNYVRIGCVSFSGTDVGFMNGQIDDLYYINGYAMSEDAIKAKYLQGTAQGITAISVTKQAIITDVVYSGGNTLITAFHGTDYALINAAITEPAYSMMKAPLGFLCDPTKWRMYIDSYVNVAQASPVNGTWYHLGGLFIDIPIGLWRVGYVVEGSPTSTAAQTIVNMWTTLSTTTNSQTDQELTYLYRIQGASATWNNQALLQITDKVLRLLAKTRYNLLSRTTATLANLEHIPNSTAPTRIIAECAYL